MATTSGLSGLKGIKIRTDYVPKAKKSAKAAVVTQICPRCRRAIPAAEMDQHVRIELLDPKWREQRDRAAENSSGTNLLTDSTISDNLKRISAYRADIFDLDETKAKDKVSKLREMAKEKEDKIWDGHSTTIVSVQQKAFTAGMAELQASIQRRLREEEEKSKIGPQAPLKPGSAPPALSGATFTGSMTVLPPTFIPFSAVHHLRQRLLLPLPGFRPHNPHLLQWFHPPSATASPPTMSAAPVMFEARPLIHPQRQQQMAPPPPSSGGPMGGYGAPPPPPPSMAAKRTASENVDGEDMPAPKRMKGEPTLPGFIPEEHFMGMAKVSLNA
ncbi:Pre-mRNA splicing factor PRP21 like protein-domain-containing protein [Chytridium lagenaria]|nr:Pre-mRNA splicing factor PRP21 like protein-domain-containing protein [Chytridium lagenaria]